MPEYKTSLKKSDFQEGKLMKSEIGGKSIVVGMVEDKLYAMDSVCSHEGGPLEEGWLEEHSLTCPWHQGIFDLRSAKASPGTNWVTDMKSYAITVDEKTGEISVEMS
jgi:nitrite reductase/ring-hydroxylating ferredoxin subunit